MKFQVENLSIGYIKRLTDYIILKL